MAEWRADARADGTWHLSSAADEAAPPRIADAVTDAAGRTWVHIDGLVVVVEAEDAPRRRHTQNAAPLEAPMPAQVTAVAVAPGDRVEEGTVLVLLEAMKMELPLRAAAAGVVRAVHCAPGDRVAPGRTLVDVESDARSDRA
ncbi:MAG TPA: biotin/lipoyl-containing protein [Luteitalea sp.]|nr:biotin/lipoyl-containing protein [Luteitalea sp.]